VYCINRATTYGFSIWEFEVYGSAAGGRQATEEVDVLAEGATELYPNPTENKVTIQIPENFQQNGSISLHNATGKSLIVNVVKGAEHTFDLSGQAPGLYIIQLSNDRERKAFKLFKK
jgi:hypothetical protein